jgi:hypothetical protein
VNSLVVSGTTVFTAGNFTTIGGQPRNYLAALDAETGLATPFNPDPSGGPWGTSVQTIVLSDDGSTLYVGGEFETIGGQPRSCIAALDAETGLATPWDPNVVAFDPNPIVRTPHVSALSLTDSGLLVGGRFNNVGGVNRLNIAALDPETGLATPWSPFVNGPVHRFEVLGPTVYIMGDFWQVGAEYRNNLAALNLATGQIKGWDPGLGGLSDYLVSALEVSEQSVWIGGRLESISGLKWPFFARFDFAEVSGVSPALWRAMR